MLSVFSPVSKANSACYYYRVHTPMKSLENLHDVLIGMNTDKANKELLIKAVLSSDINWLYAVNDLDLWHQTMSTIKSVTPTTPQNNRNYPPIFVWDADDNFDFVSPFNQSFSSHGTRNIDGDLLQPGDILTTTSGAGEEITLWEDKVTYSSDYLFDIERNINTMKNRNNFIRSCAGATACSPDLASYYRDALGQKNVHVYYNTIVPEDYQYHITPLRTDPEGTVRIFWQGGQSHVTDWLPFKAAVGQIARKYPNTKWIFFGCAFEFLTSEIPKEQLETHEWTDYSSYRLRRTLFNVDINLCPLANNIFNRCKSAIKWYESTVSHNLEATLAQDVGPYKEIIDGETGLLFSNEEEFVQKLSTLIEDAELRNRLGEGARKWVNNNRLPEHTTKPLLDFFLELKEQQKFEMGSKIIPATPQTLKEVFAKKR